MTISRRGIDREISNQWYMDVIASRLFSERRRASNVSCIRDIMHLFGGTVVETSCGVWWIGGTAQGKGDGFFPSAVGR